MVRISEIFSILCILGLSAFVCTDAFALNPDSFSGEISILAYLLAGTVDTLSVADLSKSESFSDLHSYNQGLKDGSGWHDPIGFFVVGLSGGTVFGVLGAYGAYSLAKKTEPSVKIIPPNCSEQLYKQGYQYKANNNNMAGAVIGGCLGTAIHVTLLSRLLMSMFDGFTMTLP